MARPKLGEGETHRLQLKISDEELTAIDDWRFENRVASRSEAVRRLCQIGMDFHHLAKSNSERAVNMAKALQQLVDFSDEDDHKFYSDLQELVIAVAVFSGRAIRYGGKEELSVLLRNDAELRRSAEETEADEDEQ